MKFGTTKGDDGLSEEDHELGHVLESERCADRTWKEIEKGLFRELRHWHRKGGWTNDELQHAYATVWDAIEETVSDMVGLWCDTAREGNASDLSEAIKVIHENWLERVAEHILRGD